MTPTPRPGLRYVLAFAAALLFGPRVGLSQNAVHAAALSVCREEVAFTRRGTTLTLWADTGDRAFAGLEESSEISYFGCADGMPVSADAATHGGVADARGELVGGDEAARAEWRAETDRLAREENRFRVDTRMQVELLDVNRAIRTDDTTGFTFELKSLAVVSPTCPAIGVRGTLRYRRSRGDTVRFTLRHPGFAAVSEYDSIGGQRDVPRLLLRSTGSAMRVGEAWSKEYKVYTPDYQVQATRFAGGEYVEGESVWLPEDHGDGPFEARIKALPIEVAEEPFELRVGVGL